MDASPARLRLVAAGCGRVFERFHLPALRRSPDWALAAAVDRASDRLRWVGHTVPQAALAGSLGELPAGVAADAILICTPPESHCPLASEALRRGMHILIEKPMVLRGEEATSLLRLARDVDRQIWVGYNRRFRPGYARLRQHLRTLPADRLRGIAFELTSDPAGWNALTGESGLLDDIASHQLDLVPWLLDRPVEQVRARFGDGRRQPTAVDIELRFAGGLIARCRAAHAATPLERLEVRLADRTLIADQSGVASDRWAPGWSVSGYLHARRLAGSALRRLRGAPGYSLETFGRQLAAWAAALRGQDASAAADGAAGARCVQLVEACRQSLAVGGQWIRVPSRGAEP